MKGTGAVYEVRTYGSVRGMRHKPHPTRCNKQRDKLKILFWDTNGFWLYYRRLEQGRFQWPNHAQAHVAMGIEQRQLQWLLSGLPVNNKTRHSTLSGLSVM